MFLQCLFITKQPERIFTMKTWAPCIVWPAICFSIPDLSYKVSLLHVIIKPLGQTCLSVWRSMYEKFKIQYFEHHCRVRPRCHFKYERLFLTTFPNTKRRVESTTRSTRSMFDELQWLACEYGRCHRFRSLCERVRMLIAENCGLRVVVSNLNACYSNCFRWYLTLKLQPDAL